MNRPDRDLEEILLRRDVPEMRSNLEARIIEAARKSEQERSRYMRCEDLRLNFRVWVEDMLREFVLPRPVFAVCMALVLGVLFGVFVQDVSGTSEEDMIYVYVQNSFEIEDWL